MDGSRGLLGRPVPISCGNISRKFRIFCGSHPHSANERNHTVYEDNFGHVLHDHASIAHAWPFYLNVICKGCAQAGRRSSWPACLFSETARRKCLRCFCCSFTAQKQTTGNTLHLPQHPAQDPHFVKTLSQLRTPDMLTNTKIETLALALT